MHRLVVLFLALALPAFAAEPPVPVADLAAQIASKDVAAPAPLILDVRTPEEFAAGHVPSAVLIPHDQLEARIAELGAPREVVVYCRSGRRSGLVEPILEKNGFRVHQLAGSWQAWQAAGLPEEKSPSVSAPAVAPETK
jgi:phage shock protein E